MLFANAMVLHVIARSESDVAISDKEFAGWMISATSNGLAADVPVAHRKEWIPSSRNPATVHWTVAFEWFESVKIVKKKSHPFGWQKKGVTSNGLVANLPLANCKEPAGPYPLGNTPLGCCI